MITEKDKPKNLTKSQQSEKGNKSEENKDTSFEDVVESHPEVQPILEKLEPEEITKVANVMQAEMYSGPLPHPKHLSEYADVYEDAPKIIFGMAQDQQNHKHYMEKTQMNKILGIEKLGIVLGFILAFTFLIGGLLLIAFDKEIYGVAAVIIGIITLFVRNKDASNNKSNKNMKSEDEEKLAQ